METTTLSSPALCYRNKSFALRKPPCTPHRVLPCTTPGQNQLQSCSFNSWSSCEPAFLPASGVPKAALQHPQASRGRWAHLAEVEGLHAVGDHAVGAVPRGCDAASWRLPAHRGHWLALTAAAQDACKMPQAQSPPPPPRLVVTSSGHQTDCFCHTDFALITKN